MDRLAVGACVLVLSLSGCGTNPPTPVRASLPTAASTAPHVPTTGPGDASNVFPYQPLWPFASQQEADRWLREDEHTGNSPWHAEAEATALRFTSNFLGFTEIDRITSFTQDGDEAWAGVGYLLPNGAPGTVAVIHLARFGAAENAAWEVVGTRDDVLTLDTPAYGSTAGPVIEAGGTITGVDESLHLQVRQSTQEGVLGEFCCVAAGGEQQRWSAEVTATGAQPGVLTLVVSTGGHVASVEKFAVTGLRVG